MNDEYLYDGYGSGVIVQGCLNENVHIPDEIKGRKVLAVGSLYYKNKKDVLTSKSVLGGKKYSYAFMKKLKVCGNVSELKCYAFYGSRNLEYAQIGKNVTSIENGVFAECTKLTRAEVYADIEYIPAEMFKGCSALREIYFDGNVKNVGISAFEGCANIIGFNMKNIAKVSRRSFFGCISLESIKCGNLDEIGSLAFAGCGMLRKIEIDKCSTLGDDIFKNCNNISVVRVKKGLVDIERLLKSIKCRIRLEMVQDNECESVIVPLYKSAYERCFKGSMFDMAVYDNISVEENDIEIALQRLENGKNLSEENREKYILCLEKNIEQTVKTANTADKIKFLLENHILNGNNMAKVMDILPSDNDIRSYIINYCKDIKIKKYEL